VIAAAAAASGSESRPCAFLGAGAPSKLRFEVVRTETPPLLWREVDSHAEPQAAFQGCASPAPIEVGVQRPVVGERPQNLTRPGGDPRLTPGWMVRPLSMAAAVIMSR